MVSVVGRSMAGGVAGSGWPWVAVGTVVVVPGAAGVVAAGAVFAGLVFAVLVGGGLGGVVVAGAGFGRVVVVLSAGGVSRRGVGCWGGVSA